MFAEVIWYSAIASLCVCPISILLTWFLWHRCEAKGALFALAVVASLILLFTGAAWMYAKFGPTGRGDPAWSGDAGLTVAMTYPLLILPLTMMHASLFVFALVDAAVTWKRSSTPSSESGETNHGMRD